MATQLERMMFIQGQRCFFCNQTLPKSEASVEHLVPLAKGGADKQHNIVACCKTLNGVFGSMELKEKLRAILDQNGQFICPNRAVSSSDALTPSPQKASRAGDKPQPNAQHPPPATAIAQQPLSKVAVQHTGRKALPTPSVSPGRAKIATKSKATTPASPPSQNGKLWTKEEEERLATAYDLGKTILQIAKDHQRGPGVVHAHLKKLGKIQPGERVNYSVR